MTTTNLVVGILVLAFVIYRQLIARPVRDNFRLPLLLGIIGLIAAQRVILQARADRLTKGSAPVR
jgi:hypothetical protein